MSDKIVSPKMFLHKASQAKSAVAFIEAYREWMETGQFASTLSPILARIDRKELFPTPGLVEIKNATLQHYITMEVQKAELAQSKREAKANVPSLNKNYLSHVYDAKGNELYEPKAHPFDTDAIRWCDRRLIKEGPGSYGVVANVVMFGRDGNPLQLIIQRDDAFARLLKPKKGPVVQRKGQGLSTPHVWHAKMKQTRAMFSHG